MMNGEATERLIHCIVIPQPKPYTAFSFLSTFPFYLPMNEVIDKDKKKRDEN